MTDEPKKDENSEPNADEGSAAEAAAPLEDHAGAPSEEDLPSPSAEEPTEEPSPGPEVEGAEEPTEESSPGAEEPTEESSPGAEEPTEESSPGAEEPTEEPSPEAEVAITELKVPAKAAEKRDVIPGADLEPIAVEPEAPQLSAEEQARLEAEEEERLRREAELAGEGEEPEATSRAPAKMESGARYLATGKRKNAIARVTVTPGDGSFEVNKRALEDFFPRPLHQTMARQPLVTTGYEGSVDVRVLVHGGGVSGQAGAIRHGIARALTEIDAELRGDLKRRGFLTRDARVKERRKAGLKKARKRPQFSKR